MSLLDKFRSLFGTPATRPGNAPKPAPVPNTAAAAATEERRKRVRHAARKGLKVLVIDDSATVCAVIKKILRSAGFEVEQALDAESGLALAHDFMKKPFDRFEVFARIEGLLDDQDIPRRTTPLTVLAPL